MPEAISIGPLILPTLRVGSLLLFLGASWLVLRLAERRGLEIAWSAASSERALWLGLIGARLGFAVQNWRAYKDAPWTLLYVWQPGYSLLAGVMVGAVFLLWRLWQRPQAERLAYTKILAGGFGLSLGLVLLLIFSISLDIGEGRLRVGDPAPNFHLQDLEGAPVALADLQGNAVVLNFWATWCPPCRREIPMLDAMNKVYMEKGAIVVGVDVGENINTVKRYIDDLGVTYPIWIGGEGYDNTQALLTSFGGVGLPTTVFIDPEGVIRAFQVGELSAGIVQNRIDVMLR